MRPTLKACVFLATTALSHAALADNPIYRNWDENGVDLVLGDFQFNFPEATIGRGRALLSLVRVNNGSNESSQWDRVRLRTSTVGAVTTYRVTLPDGSDDVFQGNVSSGQLTSTKGNMASRARRTSAGSNTPARCMCPRPAPITSRSAI